MGTAIKHTYTYSSELCDKMREQVTNKIVFYQTMLHHIQLLEELNHFGDLGVFDNSFVSIFDTETDPNQYISRWLNGDPEATEYVESRFTRIPFEQAYCYKNPEYQTKPRTELLKNVFGENTEWRNLSDKQNHTQIIKHFEYMCYYVINTRDELLFDVMYF